MNSKKLSPEMEVLTASLYYGVVVDYDIHDPDMRVYEETPTGAILVDDMIIHSNFLNEHVQHDYLLPYTQSIYFSAECVMNEMIRAFAGNSGIDFIKPDNITYWQGVILSLGFWEQYTKYMNKVFTARDGTFTSPSDNEFNLHRPKLYLAPAEASDRTDEDDAYGCFKRYTGKKLLISNKVNIDFEETALQQGCLSTDDIIHMCPICCVTYKEPIDENSSSDYITVCSDCSRQSG